MRITIQVGGLAWSGLSTSVQDALQAAFAHSIASSCGVGEASIVDLYGRNASVTVNSDGELNAFVLAGTGHTAAELQSRLSSTAFQMAIVDATAAILASGPSNVAGRMTLGAASVGMERFSPLPSTSDASAVTKTGITTSMGFAGDSAAAAAAAAGDAATGAATADKDASFGVPLWVCFVVASVAFAGLFLCMHRVYVMCTQQPQSVQDEEMGKQPAAQQPSLQSGLPVLLGGRTGQERSDKDGEENASTTSGDQTQSTLSRVNGVLRTSLDNVEESDLWGDDERPVHDCTRTEYDCTKGCNVSCW